MAKRRLKRKWACPPREYHIRGERREGGKLRKRAITHQVKILGRVLPRSTRVGLGGGKNPFLEGE